MTKKRVPLKLSQARAFWRNAAKADRAGNGAVARHYRAIGDARYREYVQQQETAKRLNARRGG